MYRWREKLWGIRLYNQKKNTVETHWKHRDTEMMWMRESWHNGVSVIRGEWLGDIR